jgi:hypothetical protein
MLVAVEIHYLILVIKVDHPPAPLALTAAAQETGVAQPHVRYFPGQDRLAGIGCAGDGHATNLPITYLNHNPKKFFL